MSAKMFQARQNRVLALQTIAARNTDSHLINDYNSAGYVDYLATELIMDSAGTTSPWSQEVMIAA